MESPSEIVPLARLDWRPYLNDQGCVPSEFQGQVGAYAIFNQEQCLQFVGFSRDIYLSLRQHLIRQPDQCHWIKVQAVSRLSRTFLEELRSTWLAEQDHLPPGNGEAEDLWTQPIDAKQWMTPEERAAFTEHDELGKMKTLKQVARRVEARVLEQLQHRGVQETFRFDPKLKESGLLGLK